MVLGRSIQSALLGCGHLLASRLRGLGTPRVGIPHRQGPNVGLMGSPQVVGEGTVETSLWDGFPSWGGEPPGLALSNILKPLVQGSSISHVPLAHGMKSSERTLLIHHQPMGMGLPGTIIFAPSAASMGEKWHHLVIDLAADGTLGVSSRGLCEHQWMAAPASPRGWSQGPAAAAGLDVIHPLLPWGRCSPVRPGPPSRGQPQSRRATPSSPPARTGVNSVPPHACPPGTCQCGLIWKQGLCRWNKVKTKPSWMRVGPKSNDRCP